MRIVQFSLLLLAMFDAGVLPLHKLLQQDDSRKSSEAADIRESTGDDEAETRDHKDDALPDRRIGD